MIQAIVTDIEGTTSSLSFVKDVLFPYARRHLDAYVRGHAQEPAVAALLADTRAEAGRDMDLDATIATLIRWIDEDRKITPLKALQGMIWEHGYRRGDFTGHVYQDAVQALRRWQAGGLRLYIYSSGSVQAQKLLFAHSDAGDLTPLFSGYFDTRIGGKREAGSYAAIARDIGLPPAQLLFLSDIREELDAAHAAGYHTVWLTRDSEPDPGATHRQERDFTAIDPRPMAHGIENPQP